MGILKEINGGVIGINDLYSRINDLHRHEEVSVCLCSI